jgi:hypothetical protein
LRGFAFYRLCFKHLFVFHYFLISEAQNSASVGHFVMLHTAEHICICGFLGALRKIAKKRLLALLYVSVRLST